MDLGTNLRGFGHKPASKGQGSGFSLVFAGVGGPGFRFFNGFVPKSTKVCAQIHEGLCPNPRRFVPKSTKAMNIIKVRGFVDLGTNLRGFGHKPSWIWAQTFVDLGTNLRGFGHKPSWIWAQTFVDLGTSRPRRARVRVSQRFSSKCFSLVFQVVHWLLGFFAGVGAPGFKFFTVFFHGLEGPGFRIFTGSSKGQGSGFSLAFQVLHWLFSFFVGVGAPGFKFFTVFFHGLEGPGFRIFTGPFMCQGSGFSLVLSVVRGRVGENSSPRRTRVQVFHGRARGARVQDFHWRRGPRVQDF